MCHWIRDAEFERERRAASTLPPSQPLKTPPRRLVGALAAAAAVAVAAVLMLLPAAPPADASTPQAATAGVPDLVATSTTSTTSTAGVHRTAIAPDDPAPASTTSKATGSYCSHDH
jgi:hypothetical protein